MLALTLCRSGADSGWYPSRTTDTCDGVTRRLVPCAPRGATKGLCSSVKPQSHTSGLGSGEELSERTTSSKVRSETVDSILSAVAKKKVVTSDGASGFPLSPSTVMFIPAP